MLWDSNNSPACHENMRSPGWSISTASTSHAASATNGSFYDHGARFHRRSELWILRPEPLSACRQPVFGRLDMPPITWHDHEMQSMWVGRGKRSTGGGVQTLASPLAPAGQL